MFAKTKSLKGIYEVTLYLYSEVKDLQQLQFNGAAVFIDDPLILGQVHSALVSNSTMVIPGLVSRVARVPCAGHNSYDLYVCFDPVNYNDPAARYFLARPLRVNIALEIAGLNFHPQLNNVDFARQLRNQIKSA